MWDYNKKWLKEKHHKECAAQLAKKKKKNFITNQILLKKEDEKYISYGKYMYYRLHF